MESIQWTLDTNKLKDIALKGGFFSYIAGTAATVLSHRKYYSMHAMPTVDSNTYSITTDSGSTSTFGISISNYRTTLPMRKGLSSSAAVCVLVATAFDKLYGLQLTQAEIMEIAYQVRICTQND